MSLAAAPMSLFATCPRGLEAALAEELASLGANAIKAVNGGVAYEGDQALLYRSNLHSRLATRVLLRVAQGNYRVAREQLEHCIRLAPDFADGWSQLSALQFQGGDASAAACTITGAANVREQPPPLPCWPSASVRQPAASRATRVTS